MTIRIRSMMWFVAGLVLAVALLWTSTALRVDALPGPEESTTVNVSPERVLDTRDLADIGLDGPFVSQVPQKLQITGTIPTATGDKAVVPTGATGVLLNVTGLNPSADGFISIRPGDAVGAPTTSSLNVLAGQTTPNAVQVSMPTSGPNAGQIDIVYDALGQAGPTTEMLIDVVGYTTNEGLQELRAAIEGDIVMTHGAGAFGNPNGVVQVFGNSFQNTSGTGFANMPLTGPATFGGVDFGLKSLTYCADVVAPGFITSVTVTGSSGTPVSNEVVLDGEDRTTNGCHTVEVNDGTSTSFMVAWGFGGGGPSVFVTSVTTTWSPVDELARSASPPPSIDSSENSP